MSSASNLYAEKVFAEHPIALWALDEPIDYVSIVSESDRVLSYWTISGGSASGMPSSAPNSPFLDSATVYFVGTPSGVFNTVSLISPTISNFSRLDQSLETISIGAYLYANHEYVSGYEIGFRYTDPVTQVSKDVVRSFNIDVGNQWSLISETFVLPTVPADFSIIIRARYSVDIQEPLPEYGFYLNGISVGQWSESFNATSLGINISSKENLSEEILPSSSGLSVIFGSTSVLADANSMETGNKGTLPSYSPNQVIVDVAHGNGKTIALPYGVFSSSSGSPTMIVPRSDDGISWVSKIVSLPPGTSTFTTEKIVFGNGKFVIFGSGGRFFVSADNGESWTAGLLPSSLRIGINSAPKYLNGRFIIASNTDNLLSSTDGASWSISPLPDHVSLSVFPIQNWWGGIAYGNGKHIVAQGYSPSGVYKVAVSDDNMQSWNLHVVPFAGLLGDVSFVNGRFIIFGGTSPLISEDGISWTIGSSSGYGGLAFISHTDEEYVYSMPSFSNRIDKTKDGISWETISFGEYGATTGSTKAFTTVRNSQFGIPASAYGRSDNSGYYVADNKRIFAKNTSIPMVYGSSSVTKITKNPYGPSIVLPGQGFLNESGRYQEYTLEMWIRAKSTGNQLRRIFGPINSDDGVYINGTFITLVIGNQVSSHFIGDWYRPMLLDLKLGIDYANLFINGEQVASVIFSTKDLELPSEDKDWIGLYAYDDVEFIEFDAIGIYPYQIPSILIKRRFAFGQAVESPEGTNRAYGGVTAFIDYKFADYTNNYSYPKIGRWDQGISENLDTGQNKLSPPTYKLPELVLSSGTADEWLSDQYVAANNTNSYLKFETAKRGYFFLDSFNLSFQAIKGVYGIFEISQYSSTDKTLIKIENAATNSYLKVSLNSEYILYRFKFWGEERTLYLKSGVSTNTKFFAGVDVDDLANFFGEDVLSFFGNTNQLRIYVANEVDMNSQFDGKIHKFGICSARNLSKIKDSFDNLEIDARDLTADPGAVYFGNSSEFWQFFVDGGLVTSFEVDAALDHIASYTLIGKSNFGKTYLDLETDSYWEDYIPLSTMAQYVKNIFGDYYYDLDFLQFNINYPGRQKFIGNSYDTSEELVKTFISFQYLSTGANAPEGAFSSIEPMPKNGVVIPGDNWKTTKYEVVDGAIIYPPTDVNINDLAIVTSVQLSVSGTSTNPISIRSLEYASQAFNDQTANPVKTKFGVDISPYTQLAALFDYKAENPFRIYKGSTPHLYLSDDSGIQRVGRTEAITPRGLSIPINASSATQYRLNAIQMFLFYNKDKFSSSAVQLFEIKGSDTIIRFYVKANDKSGKRARIYGISGKTATTEDGIAFFVNGKMVREAVISLNEWTSLGIAFATPMVFDEYPGALRLTDTVLFNNISHYESSSLQEIQRQSKRTWSKLNADNDSWLEVLRKTGSGNFLWNDVLVISTVSFFGINPGDIYKSYIGTNKIIVDGAQNMVLGNAECRVFTDVQWFTTIANPV